MTGFRWSDVAHFTACFDTDDLILSGALKPKQSWFSAADHASTQILTSNSDVHKRCPWCLCDFCRFAVRKFAKLTRGNAIHCKHGADVDDQEPCGCDLVGEVGKEFGVGECGCQGCTFDEHYRMGQVTDANYYENLAWHASKTRGNSSAATVVISADIIKKSYEDILMEDEVHMDSFSHSQLSSPTVDLDNQTAHSMQDQSYSMASNVMQNPYARAGIPHLQQNWTQTNQPRVSGYQQNLDGQSPMISELLRHSTKTDNALFPMSNAHMEHDVHPSLNMSDERAHNPARSLFSGSSAASAEMRMTPRMQNTKQTNAWNIDLKNPSATHYLPQSNFDNLTSRDPRLAIVHPLIIHQKPPKSSPSSKQKDQKDRIKRPLNAFMIFMREMRATYNKDYEVKESALINQIIAKDWNAMDDESKQKYKDMAAKEKEEHALRYPLTGQQLNNTNLTPGGSGRKKPRCSKKCSTIYGSDNIDAWCDICKSRRRVIKFAKIVNEHDKSKPDQ